MAPSKLSSSHSSTAPQPRSWLWRCRCGTTYAMGVTRHCLHLPSECKGQYNVWVNKLGVRNICNERSKHGKGFKRYTKAPSNFNYRTWQVRRGGQPPSLAFTPEEIEIWNSCYEPSFDHLIPKPNVADSKITPFSAAERIGRRLLKEINKYREVLLIPPLALTELGPPAKARRAAIKKAFRKDFLSTVPYNPSRKVETPGNDTSWWDLLWYSRADARGNGSSTDPAKMAASKNNCHEEAPVIQLSSTNISRDNDDGFAPPIATATVAPTDGTQDSATVSPALAPIPSTGFTDLWGRRFDLERGEEYYDGVGETFFYRDTDGVWKPIDEETGAHVAGLPTAPEWMLVGMGVQSRRRRDSGYESCLNPSKFLKEAL